MTTYSDEIRRCRLGVVQNPYQGKDKRVLFVCSMGLLRSATGARIYADKFNTRSVGSWDDALIPITENLILWADEVVFVNKKNYIGVVKKFGDEELAGKTVVLDIPDQWPHMHPKLIEAFDQQYLPSGYLERNPNHTTPAVFTLSNDQNGSN